MNIEILTSLRDYPKRYPNDAEDQHPNIGLSMTEIQQLEQNWNSGNPFPQALRELLYLAGDYCYCLSYGYYDNQDELQEDLRHYLEFKGQLFTRPFFVVDAYEASEFLFVYLDENQIDPAIYSYSPNHIPDRPLDFPLGYTLSHLINLGITAVKEGRNPM